MNALTKKTVTLLATIALALLLSSCAGSFGRATDFHDAGAARMNQFGHDDEEVIRLYTQAIEEYKVSIAEGNNAGKSHLYYGRILFTGPLSMRNYDEALIHLNEALKILEKENDKEFIAICYSDIGAVQLRMGDYASAFANFTKASEIPTEKKRGVLGLASMYKLGLGVEQDLPEAMKLYRLVALTGRDLWANIYETSYQINELKKGNYDSKAMHSHLTYLYATNVMYEPKSVWMPILTESADLGYPPAQVDLWVTYRDNNEAAKGMPYLEKALAYDFAPAYFHMGYVYEKGLGGKGIDYKEAQKWYEKAAVEGHPPAQNNLGLLYFNNWITADGELSNQEMAYYWWNAGAEQGQSNAVSNLKLVGSYRPPQSKLETTLQILNTVLSITQASIDTYNTLNKSKMKSYTPPGRNNNAQQRGQNNNQSQTSQTSNEPQCTCTSIDANAFIRSYDADEKRLEDMNSNYAKYDDSNRQRYQRDMKSTRETFERNCSCLRIPFSKSDWEDWNGKKR